MDIKAQLDMQARYNSGSFDAPAVTRQAIASMKKSDVAEYLEAHGVTPSGTVAEMRKTLISIMFVEA